MLEHSQHSDHPVPESADPAPGVTALLRETHRLTAKALSNRIAPYGVTIGQWHFLRALWDEDGITQRELSHRVGMMEPTTVTALNGMERGGLVRRVRNPRDRRKLNVFLTETGKALKGRLLPLEAALNNEVATIAAGAPSLEAGLQAILDNLERG